MSWVVALIQAVAAIKQKSDEAEKKKADANWQQSVIGILANIFNNTELILKDLQRLRIDIAIIVDQKFHNVYVNGLRATLSNLIDIVAGADKEMTRDQKRRVVAQIDILRIEIYKAPEFGFAAIPTVLTCYVVLESIMRLANFDKDELMSTRKQAWEQVFQPSVSETKPGNYYAAMVAASDESGGAKNFVQSHLRPTSIGLKLLRRTEPYLVIPSLGESLYEDYSIQVTTTFVGDVETPASIHATPQVEAEITGLQIPWPLLEPAPLDPNGAAYFPVDINNLYNTIPQLLRNQAEIYIAQRENAATLKSFIESINEHTRPT